MNKRPTLTLAALVMLSAVVLGCRSASKSQPPSGASSTDVPKVHASRTYDVFLESTVIGGKVFASDNRRIASLLIDSTRKKLFWDGIELIRISKTSDEFPTYRFFNPTASSEISFSKRGRLCVVAQGPRSPYRFSFTTTLMRTNGQVLDDLAQFDFTPGYIALFPTTRYVDGTPIEEPDMHFIGALTVTQIEVSFNGASASVTRGPVGSSVGTIMLSTVDQDLVIWPDGTWIYYFRSDPSLALSGREPDLQSAYMALRSRATLPLPDSVPAPRPIVPKELMRQSL